MIKALNVYLITDGNGQEAVRFYQEVFDTELLSLTLWQDQIPDCPKDRAQLVLNAQLAFDGIILQLSDENPDNSYRPGTNMSAAIIVDSVERVQKRYDKLAVDAKSIALPLQETFWSPAYANLIDKFGIFWQISTEL
ncbi:VOC family protein [Streptococcus halichoeri]|uniref:VOC family protein n=1 Tax=Streptococcus halichoeri TaxID=254785 RepID=UPI001C8D0022|nr:VOC family protein [Streptococcus halichoeri]